jgi:hypothetical protein
MRYIPQSLLNKLQERFQGKSTDSQPSIRLIATQATVNTLISEPVVENIPQGACDVTLRQLKGEETPSNAYAIFINNGIAKLYQRRIPANIDNPWVHLWTLGAAKTVAIEFDGHWRLEPQKRWYVLETHDLPYIFWTDPADNLYAQKWQDESTRMLLAVNVLQISACRGWRSIFEGDHDQGLIIGYIKSGNVLYRSLCQQETGEQLWENEWGVAELSSGNTSICVFRTNDYRVGFITENNGQMKWILSQRNYVGMAARPESINVQIQEVSLLLEAFIPMDARNVECVEIMTCNQYLLLYTPEQDLQLSVTNTLRISETQIKLELSHPLVSFTADFALSLSVNPPRVITDIYYDNLQQALIITFDSPIVMCLDITISSDENRSVRYCTNSGQSSPWPAMTVLLEGGPRETLTNESVGVSMEESLLCILTPATKGGYTPNEKIQINTEGVLLILATIGNYPI